MIDLGLIMNSLMVHERELFVEEHEGEQCNGFRPPPLV